MTKKRLLIILISIAAAVILIALAAACSRRSDPAGEPAGSGAQESVQAPAAETATPVSTFTPAPFPGAATVFAPTCTTAGYTLFDDGESIRIVDGEPALGHRFGEWTTASTGAHERICHVCGYKEHQEPTIPDALPRLTFTGSMEGISKDHRITLSFSFDSPEHSFACYSFTTWQGHESMSFDKKNYTIRLYDDEAITRKHRLVFGGWQQEHKYILKANYRDLSFARNLAAAQIWADMAITRPGLPNRLALTSNFGAVAGFPVTLWVNGEFHGLYTMNLHKDEDLYGMGGVEKEAIMITNAQTMDESLFRAPAAFEEDVSDWELEYCGTDMDTAWATESFNELIRFVMTSSDEAFRHELGAHLDVNAAIDYLLYIYALGLTDAGAVDLVMIKYPETPWIPTVYDMEDGFGLNPEGTALVPAGAFVPEKKDGVWSSGTGSLLWDRLLQLYEPQIRARWHELRQGALSKENMLRQVAAVADSIPPELIQADLALYPDRGTPDMDPRAQITRYITERMPVLDRIFKEENP